MTDVTPSPPRNREIPGWWVVLAMFFLGNLGRLNLVLGDLDEATAVQAEGERLLARVDPDSKAAGQFAALQIVRSILVDDELDDPLVSLDAFLAGADRPDLRWASGPLRMWHASLTSMLGRHDAGVAELADNLAVVELATPGAGNYLFAVHCAAQCLWAANRADHVPVLETNLHAKVLEPDFCYSETDGRWTAALLCALTGRPDEAREWFQRAYDRLTDQEAVLLLPHVCCDEPLMEARLGAAGDRAHGLRRLDEADAWVDRIGLPKLRRRIDDLRRQLSN